jgi:hypothetical protein
VPKNHVGDRMANVRLSRFRSFVLSCSCSAIPFSLSILPFTRGVRFGHLVSEHDINAITAPSFPGGRSRRREDTVILSAAKDLPWNRDSNEILRCVQNDRRFAPPNAAVCDGNTANKFAG